jgi:hypothetical protein
MLIEPDKFCNGLLNFSPPDIRSLDAIRSDSEISEYCAKVRSLLDGFSSDEKQRKILKAMSEAHEKCEFGERTEMAFETLSWIIKPIHYFPIAGNVLNAAEDLKDIAMKWADRKISDQEWYLLAAKMQNIATKEYLRRKGNVI